MTIVAPEPSHVTADAAPGASGARAPSTARRGRLPYFPALDGLRGAAVAGVLLFHGGFEWMQGGFLGVSTFFTLSGFLITSLLLAERGATAQINLKQFWTRRFRRLMPAAMAAITLAITYTVIAGDEVQKRNLGGDVLASLAYVANWRFLFSEQSYADVFGAPSPLLHFWSLAIEEQFYLLFPLLGFAVLHHYAKSRQWFGAVLAGLIAVSLGCTLALGLSDDAIYYGTETRMAELLIGALLAVLVYDRRVTHRLANDHLVRNALAGIGAAALVAAIALWSLTTISTDWLYDGGFAGYALLSALAIVAAILPVGPLRWVLALAPLRWLGVISYGVYLYHWPIFLWIDEVSTGITNPYVLFLPRMAATLALALLSYRFLEMPVRRGQRLFSVRPIMLAPVAVVALLAAGIVVTANAPKPVIDFDAAAEQLSHVDDAPSAAPTTVPGTNEPPFPRMAMFGDSTALMTAIGLDQWARETRRADFVDGAAWLGCGIGRGGERRDAKGQGEIPAECNHWDRTWSQKVINKKPNIAIVQIGPWEVADRKLEGEDVWRAPGDPVYDDFLLNEMLLAVDTLSKEGATVIWLTSPEIGPGANGTSAVEKGPPGDPARMRRVNELIDRLPSLRPGRVVLVDLAAWVAANPDDPHLRPDGVHFGNTEGASETKQVATTFLGPAIVDAFTTHWREKQELEREIALGKVPGTTSTTTATTTAPSSSVYAGPTRRVLVFGDASATPIGAALERWGKDNESLDVSTVTQPECGFLATVERLDRATVEPTPPDCGESWVYAMLQATVSEKPDMIVIMPSVWDLTDNRLLGDTERRTIGTPAYDEAMWAQLDKFAKAMKTNKTVVVWVNTPPYEWGKGDDPPPATPYSASDPARAKRYNELLIDLARTTAYMQVVDFAEFARNWAEDPDHRSTPLRPDGVTIGPDAQDQVAAWLGAEILVKMDEFLASNEG